MTDAEKSIKILGEIKAHVVPNIDKINALDFAIEAIRLQKYEYGKWIPKKVDGGMFDLYTTTYFYECSHCGKISRVITNYCSNCGFRNKVPDGWTYD